MNKLKKIIILIVAMVGFALLPNKVLAANARVTVSGSSTVVVGNKLTVYVTISSDVNLGTWQMNLKYDKNYLQLTSANSEHGGTTMAGFNNGNLKKKTYTFTFKTLKKGSTRIEIVNCMLCASTDTDSCTIKFSTSPKNVRIITQAELEASYSKDNNLKSLSVEGFDLEPAFNANVLEYSITVPEDTKEIKIDGVVNDNRSTITGTGTHEVTTGDNSFDIVVRAQNGSEKTYKINVEVKDLNPINIELDGKNYTVVKIKEQLPAKNNYTDGVIKINDLDVPCYQNNKIKVTLVGLKDETGKIALYKYNEETKKFSSYNEIGTNRVIIYPIDTDKKVDGYTKDEIVINGVKTDAYFFNSKSRFCVIYGINIETGEEGFYMYDKDNQNVMKYNDEYSSKLSEKLNLYSYIIFGFSGILIILLLIMIFGKSKKNKKKSVKELKQEGKKQINDEIKIEKVEPVKKDDFEDKSKKKKKNKKETK